MRYPNKCYELRQEIKFRILKFPPTQNDIRELW